MNDALTDLLAVAGVRGSLISRARLSSPFGVSTAGMPKPVFHAPLSGSAWIRTADGRVFVEPGDVAVLPHAHPHDVLNDLHSRCRHISRFDIQREPHRLPTLVNGTASPTVDMVCGSFALGAPAHRVLLGSLPSVFAVKGRDASPSFVRATLTLLEQEIGANGLGGQLVSNRLVEVLVVYLLRAWGDAQPVGTKGWLAGLHDPHLGPVLHAIHAEPAGDWTLLAMSRRAGLSRSRFIERFQRQVGMAPGRWMTEWRIAVAQRALRDGADVSSAAERAGYSSDASFSRAFKRVAGVSPAAWRRADAR